MTLSSIQQELLAQPLPVIGLDDTPAIAGMKIVRGQLIQALLYQPIAREGFDPEGVHKMRVAFRRLRAALRMFKAYYPKTVLKPIRAGTLKAREVLGLVRDLDVLWLDFQSLAANPAAPVKAITPIWLKPYQQQYLQARRALLQSLDSGWYAELIVDLYRFTDMNSLHGAHLDAGLADSLPAFLPGKLHRLLDAMMAYTFADDTPYGQYHALRIAAKRLRYALEFFAPVLDAIPLGALLVTLTSLQDHLGVLNDGVVACRFIEQYMNAREKGSTDHYCEYRKAQVHDLIASFDAVWTDFKQADTINQLDQCLGPMKAD